MKFKIKSKKFDEVYAKVEVYQKDDLGIEYEGEIVENRFPKKLISLVTGFHKAIDDFSFVVLEQIEREILSYDLVIDKSVIKIYHLKLEGDKISFYTKFPSANGFLDKYPRSLS